MQDQTTSDRAFEWLDHVQPVGLVLARSLLKSLGLHPERQDKNDENIAVGLLNVEVSKPALKDPWAFFERVLSWQSTNVAGAPGGPQLDNNLTVGVAEYDTALSPTWALRGMKGEPPWQLLVRIEEAGIDPDRRTALKGWEATPHQRFERLLRDTQVHAGVLVTDHELRLVYAPRGETSGWIAYPLRPLGTVAGRSMLGGLKLALGSFRLFNDSPERRLPALLRNSREAQATVSTHLSAQVLGALYELLRGLHAADPKLIGELAHHHPQQLYEGLLSVLMRLVFVLYAEDRDLIPSHTDGRAKALYEQGYSVRGLFEKLSADEARYPDIMNERVGGWGRLLALFRLVHSGHDSGWIKGRGGKLFNPDAHPFLEGRAAKSDPPRVLALSDGALLRILRGLLVVDGERLSYRTLDVEQVGSVYETVMGFTVMLADGSSLAIKAGKNNKTPVFVDLAALYPLKPAARIKEIKEKTDRKLTGQSETKVKQAKSVEELAAALDSVVDERGSPARRAVPANTPILQPTDERRRTGSHYTPRSLTEPIVRHALEPAFECIGDNAKPEDVLALKVCDPAMGSGAFLVEACRMLAARLVKAWAQWPATKPTIPPDEDDDLHARRIVTQRCLYGVDKNPMATDLAKLSLWLATLARDHEFEFVDHALKTGDSLVGLTSAQIAAANWDANAQTLFTRQIREKVKVALKIRDEIRDAPDGEFSFVQERRNESFDRQITEPRLIGDAVISAYFAEDKPRAREQQRMNVEGLIAAPGGINFKALEEAAARLRQGDHPIRPFHWQLEFPEVFEGKNPGFDAIVGNPPFLGGKRISNELSFNYNFWLEQLHSGASRNADLVAHFFRRVFGLLKQYGTFGLIATNTIGQGDTRATGLTAILAQGGAISHATRRLRWPGEAAVVVSVVQLHKGKAVKPLLDGRPVSRISAYLVEGELDVSPKPLAANAGKSFVGSFVLGMGFTFDDEAAATGAASSRVDMKGLIARDQRNAERIFPYIGGEEVNSHPRHAYHRYSIDFFDRPLSRDPSMRSWNTLSAHQKNSCLVAGIVPSDYPAECADEWPDLLSIVREKVKPERDVQKRPALRERWWQYADKRPGLYRAIADLPQVLARSLTSAHFSSFTFLPSGWVYDQTLLVFAYSSAGPLAALNSRAHEVWGHFLGSTLEDRGRYNLEDCFRNFPFPPGFETDPGLEAAGRTYHDHRAALMVTNTEGLTKTYNRFHDPADNRPEIVKLRELHDAMDQAVLKAYGWDDLAGRIASDADARPRHLTLDYEADHKYQGRYFWPAPIRDEILARLLSLNAERAEAERRAGVAPAAAAGHDQPESDPEVGEDREHEDEDADGDA
jgi:hypothetical protein